MPITIEAKRIMAQAGGEEAVELRLRRFEEDVRFLHSLRQEFLRKYLNEWIAVYDKSVVGHAKTFSELRKQLTLKNVPHNEAVVEYIASERKMMLL
jgi:hypothetical protein